MARVGGHVYVYPPGATVPARAYVYGPASAEVIYQAWFAATHCRHGHRRGYANVCRYRGNCAARPPGDWT